MGWTFSSSWETKEHLVDSLRRDMKDSLVASVVRGSRHWYVRRLEDGRCYIGLDLLAKDSFGRSEWGYKDMDESCGPAYYDCPLKFLDLAQPAPTEGWAAEWREKVRQWHQAKKERPVWSPGMVVSYGNHNYRLLRPYAPRKGWAVLEVQSGIEYRMGANQLSKSKLLEDDHAKV